MLTLVVSQVATAQYSDFKRRATDTLLNADTVVYEVRDQVFDQPFSHLLNYCVSVDSVSGSPTVRCELQVTNFVGVTPRWVTVRNDTISPTGARRTAFVEHTTNAYRARLLVIQGGSGRRVPTVALVVRRKP